MEKYIYSGGLTRSMADLLKKIETFEPIDVLVTQLDRSSIKRMIEFIDEGIVKSLFIDSGAFSYHTGKCDKIDVDEYIDYVNSIDQYIYAVAQVDTLPGEFGKPKSPEDYKNSADRSWDNFLYMYPKMKSPEKLVPVFHFGEHFESTLGRMLDWRDPNGKPLDKVGLSPANDTGQNTKDIYLKECYDFIAKSSNPQVKTHLFGMTSLQSLAKFPCYSADSVSHRLRAAYVKVLTLKWGTISLTDKTRSNKAKSNMSFLQLCDENTYRELEEICERYHLTVQQLKEDNAARVAFDIMQIQEGLKGEYKYKPENLRRSKKLF